jgi:hypothetical protein
MPTRLILSSGEDLLSSWPIAVAVEQVGQSDAGMLSVPLVAWERGPERMAFVRPAAIEALEPLDDREVAAFARDRLEWIEGG